MPTPLTPALAKTYATAAGAAVCGIASAAAFTQAPPGSHPTDVLPACASVLVLGAPSPPEALRDASAYTASRNAMLTAMTQMAKDTAKRIKSHGHQAHVISAAGGRWVQGDGRKEQIGYISLKHAAELAGLGIIGKNYLLWAPQHGNLLWLSAVLTDAQLAPDARTGTALCDGCSLCVDACPVGALDDLTRFGRRGCSRFFTMEDRKFVIKCHACRAVCPHGLGMQRDGER